jgi:DNA-binding IclR family transcriptional regulator
MRDIIKTTDHRYYEVTLVVAIPDYQAGDNGYTALDALSEALNQETELVVLEMAQTEVQLVVKTETTKPITSAVTTTTYTNIVNAGGKVVTASKPKARKKVKAAKAYTRWTDAEVLAMMELHDKGVSVKEIAKVTGRSVSAIGNAVWVYKKGGK